MKRISSLLLLLLLITACNVPSTPIAEETPAPYSPATPSPPQINAPLVASPALVSIHFFNELDGWGVTETQIIRTNDGGITWYNVTPQGLAEAGYIVELFALDHNNVWVHKPDFGNFPNSGVLYYTSDGGMRWTNRTTPFSSAQLYFLDANNGWALADLGVAAGSNAVAVYQTTDGGATWTQKYANDPNRENIDESLPFGGLKSGLAPLNMQTAWVYGVTYASGVVYLYRTDDGGASWREVTLPLPPGAETSQLGIDRDQMKFVSPNDGFIALRLTGDAYQLAIYVTRDAGNTWTLTPTLIPTGGSVNFLSAEEAVVYNGEQFYVTRDAARTWRILPPDVKFGDTFSFMDFVNPNSGWLITLDPTNRRSLYRTHDGGATWLPINP